MKLGYHSSPRIQDFSHLRYASVWSGDYYRAPHKWQSCPYLVTRQDSLYQCWKLFVRCSDIIHWCSCKIYHIYGLPAFKVGTTIVHHTSVKAALTLLLTRALYISIESSLWGHQTSFVLTHTRFGILTMWTDDGKPRNCYVEGSLLECYCEQCPCTSQIKWRLVIYTKALDYRYGNVAFPERKWKLQSTQAPKPPQKLQLGGSAFSLSFYVWAVLTRVYRDQNQMSIWFFYFVLFECAAINIF